MTAPAPQPPPPPWAWSNLTEDEAQDLDANLEAWIGDWNRHLALEPRHLITACWRRHAALVQELPVQFFAWKHIHRSTGATAPEAADYYGRTLPGFRDRLAAQHGLLGPDSAKCRAGKHPASDPTLEDAIRRAATDVAAFGPDNIDVLRSTAFGT